MDFTPPRLLQPPTVFFLNGDTYTIYDYPGAYDTRVVGINDAGDIVGTYILTDNSQGGFAVVGGVLEAITVPDSTYVSPSDINNRGDIVGWYNTPDASLGFRLQSNGTLIIRFAQAMPKPPSYSGPTTSELASEYSMMAPVTAFTLRTASYSPPTTCPAPFSIISPALIVTGGFVAGAMPVAPPTPISCARGSIRPSEDASAGV